MTTKWMAFKWFCIVTGILILTCCTSSGEKIDTYGYKIYDVGPGGLKLAVRMMADGKELERGFIKGNKKEGVWTVYHHENNFVKYVTGYLNGMKNGAHLEFNDRGQLELEANYVKDVLHGPFVKYSFNRILNKSYYFMGKLDGTYEEYNERGQLQRTVEFNKGIEDGYLRYYGESGEITIEYFYENGQRISGGIIEKEENTVESDE